MSLISDLIEVANEIVGDFDLLSSITHLAYLPLTQSETGGRQYAQPVTLHGVIDDRQRLITDSKGNTITAMSTITFLELIPPNGSPGRREPIDLGDILILPSGFTGPIIEVPGSTIDPETGRGFITTVMLGRRG